MQDVQISFSAIVAILGLLVFLLVVVNVFLANKSINAATQTIQEFRKNPDWMNAVEKGITGTVPNEVVLALVQKFDTLAELAKSLLPGPDQKQFVDAAKDLVDAITDGKPNLIPDGGSILNTAAQEGLPKG